jgi:hypothetical protein
MLRTLLLLIALVVLIVIALIATGYLNLQREADGGMTLRTRDVEVGTSTTNVQVPVVRMENRQVEVPSVGLEEDEAQANAQ